MDQKKLLETINTLIKDAKLDTMKKAVSELYEYAKTIQKNKSQELKKSIEAVEEILRKGSAVNLYANEEMAKVDPVTKLPGTMIDKAAPDMAPPMEKKERMHQELARCMAKCMKSLSASEKPEALGKPYASDAQRRWAHSPAGEKALGGKAAVHHWDKESKGKDLPEHVEKADSVRPDAGWGKVTIKDTAAQPKISKPAPVAKPAMQKSNEKDPVLGPAAQEKPASDSYKKKADAYMKKPLEKGFGTVTVKEPAPTPIGSVIMKDDVAHAAGSPEERSHAVAEGMSSLPNAMRDLKSSGAREKFFAHLKTLKDKSKHRSPENITTKAELKEDVPSMAHSLQDISKEAEKAIVASAEKPIKIEPARPGQANEPKKDRV